MHIQNYFQKWACAMLKGSFVTKMVLSQDQELGSKVPKCESQL